MIYLDSSVALAYLLGEERTPPISLWRSPLVSSRPLHPFPAPVRTLDALHLASAEFLRAQGQSVAIASYDDRLLEAARRMGFEIADV